MENRANCSYDDGCVCVLEFRGRLFQRCNCFVLVLRLQINQAVKEIDNAPFVALLDSSQDRCEDFGSELGCLLLSLRNVHKRRTHIRDNRLVLIYREICERI